MKKLSFQQQVLVGFATTLLIVFSLAVVSYLSIRGRINDLQEEKTWVNYSRDAVDNNNKVLQYLVDAETGERGYVLTGDSRFLKPFNTSLSKVNMLLGLLRIQLQNTEKTDSLENYTALLVTDMKRVIDVYDNRGMEAARLEIQNGKGKLYMDSVRNMVYAIRKNKTNEISNYVASSITSSGSDRTLIIILSGSFTILCLVLILLSYIIRTFKQQQVAEDNVRHTNLQLEEVSEENKRRNWLLTGASTLEKSMQGEQVVKDLAANIINELARYTQAKIGAIYLLDDQKKSLEIAGTFAYDIDLARSTKLKLGEGLAGQAAADRKQILLNDVPEDYVKIRSGTGETSPKTVVFQPFMLDNDLKGVIELGYLSDPDAGKMQFIRMVTDSIAIAIDTAQARVKMQQLFGKTQQQAEELESQQEELRTTNEELMRKTGALQASEEELHVQQEELRQINSELKEKAELLEERNRIVDQAREAISTKAEELELISKYKSEFLANMSHELRTPLNSILILARILKENKNENLSDEQVKYASVIHNAGSDLLTLINDILDLSKIESGKVELSIEKVKVKEVQHDLELLFKEVAGNKKIRFQVNIAGDVPETIVSDRLRVEQILKNLLSNAFKFTPEKGSVTVDVGVVKDTSLMNDKLRSGGEPVFAFSVTDTGIGIPIDKQKAIFEAFQQADGSTSRKYGGTGLGLSISRELASILGGQIELKSTAGEGSVFTLYMPQTFTGDPNQGEVQAAEDQDKEAPAQKSVPTNDSPAGPSRPPKNDRQEHLLLIIEDDEVFADVLKDYATDRGFKVISALQGDTGLQMAMDELPDAIVLDVMLPVMDGWQVLKKLKDSPATKDIPVHMMSAGDEKPKDAKQLGAIGFLKKPIIKEKLDKAFDLIIQNNDIDLNKVLIIEDHKIQSEIVKRQLLDKNVEVEQAFDGEGAMKLLNSDARFDCIILDLNLPDISGLDLLDKIKQDSRLANIPVVINTAMELTQESMSRVMKHTHAMVLKSNKSNERLLDEVNLFMHKIKEDDGKALEGRGGGNKKADPANSAILDKALKGKEVLIVDDDMRNVFAITSALQQYELKLEIANDGKEALKKLDEKPGFDLVLMDIMMPEMDGYEAMHEIRKQKRFLKLPIIALTAKAMKADRDKCIEAGANDYISKPVDIDQLLSLMRVWIS